MEVQLLPLLLGVVDGVEHRRLQTREGHIQGVVRHVGPGEGVGLVVAPLGHLVHGSAAGIAQPKHPGDFVKALPRRVVPGTAQHLKVGVVLHIHQGSGAAGDAQAQKGRLQIGVGDVVGGDVAPDVVHRDEGYPQTVGHRLGKGHPHQQSPDEAGGVGHGHGVNLRLVHPSLAQSLVGQAGNGLHMLAGGNLWHHAAVNGVHVRRGGNHRGQDGAAILHHSGGGLVTGGFKG